MPEVISDLGLNWEKKRVRKHWLERNSVGSVEIGLENNKFE